MQKARRAATSTALRAGPGRLPEKVTAPRRESSAPGMTIPVAFATPQKKAGMASQARRNQKKKAPRPLPLLRLLYRAPHPEDEERRQRPDGIGPAPPMVNPCQPEGDDRCQHVADGGERLQDAERHRARARREDLRHNRRACRPLTAD